jgi:putative NADPH-quinone reductase
MTTALIVGHPDLGSSRLSAALVRSARSRPEIDVRVIRDLPLTSGAAIVAEQAALLTADRIVLLYPTFWYSTPGVLKSWMDAVFTRGWAYGTGAPGALAGKTLSVVTTTGGAEAAYRRGELHSFEYDAILAPLKATAHRLGMRWGEPLVVHGARDVDDAGLTAVIERFEQLLTAERTDRPVRRAGVPG